VLAIPVANASRLEPNCIYWSRSDQSMRHPPDAAACVSFAADHTQTVVAAYGAELTRAGWRLVDQFANQRLYEKTIAPGCTQRVDFAVYSTTPPTNPAPARDAVIVFTPHPGPVCVNRS
jgi:hypothetical protein